MLFQHVLAHDADVGGPVLDEDGHVGGTAHDELGIGGPVDESAPVLPHGAGGEAGRLKRRQGVSEDGALRNGDAQPAQGITVSATVRKSTNPNSSGWSTPAS